MSKKTFLATTTALVSALALLTACAQGPTPDSEATEASKSEPEQPIKLTLGGYKRSYFVVGD